MAHPVRPDSYMEINNFYTATVYSKGAELVRMQHTILGAERFRRGMDLYFARFDGQAVTVDDFVQTMAEAGEIDLDQFALWYWQAGTPRLNAAGSYNPAEKNLHPDGQPESARQPPASRTRSRCISRWRSACSGRNGAELPLTLAGESAGTDYLARPASPCGRGVVLLHRSQRGAGPGAAARLFGAGQARLSLPA